MFFDKITFPRTLILLLTTFTFIQSESVPYSIDIIHKYQKGIDSIWGKDCQYTYRGIITYDSTFSKHAKLIGKYKHFAFYEFKDLERAKMVFNYLMKVAKGGFKEDLKTMRIMDKGGVVYVSQNKLIIVVSRFCSQDQQLESQKEDILFENYLKNRKDTTFLRTTCGFNKFEFR